MSTAVSPEPKAAPAEPKRMAVNEELRRIPIAELHDSALNPRKYFDPIALEELKESLLQGGQIDPMIVRPIKKGGFEIAAGHRRKRACLLAIEKNLDGARYRRLDQPLCLVREMDDVAFIETLNIDNLIRSDLRPLEEARGFADLQKYAAYDIEKIHHRTGKSERYVYDTLTLLKLIPPVRELLEQEIISKAHAIEIARETSDDQEKIVGKKDTRGWNGHSYTGGLFEFDEGEPELGLKDRRKPRSLRELKTWINDHIRQAPDRVDPMLFPESADRLAAAAESTRKVVSITRDHMLKEDARDDKSRTYGEQSWKRADGNEKSRTCPYAVLGLIVAGPGRSEAFDVCVNKDKCKVHWPQQVAAVERRKKAVKKDVKAGGGTVNQTRAAEKEKEVEAKRQAERQAREERDARWKKAGPALIKELVTAVEQMPAKAKTEMVLARFRAEQWNKLAIKLQDLVPTGAALLAKIVSYMLLEDINDYQFEAEILSAFRLVGIKDKAVEAIVDKAAPPVAEKKIADNRKTGKKPKAKNGKVKK